MVLVRNSSTGGGGEDEKINGNGMGPMPSLDRTGIPSIVPLVLWLADRFASRSTWLAAEELVALGAGPTCNVQHDNVGRLDSHGLVDSHHLVRADMILTICSLFPPFPTFSKGPGTDTSSRYKDGRNAESFAGLQPETADGQESRGDGVGDEDHHNGNGEDEQGGRCSGDQQNDAGIREGEHEERNDAGDHGRYDG